MRLKRNLGMLAGVLALAVAYMTALVQGFNDEPPQYNYDTLPKTSFNCKDKFPGRYYADPETDCQVFHVCVKMNSRDIHDFKFLCPNGTTFDQEHQVCMDYFQVVCHGDIGTNPLGHIYELMKLSSGHKNAGLDADKFSFVDPDVAERNTLGDDFQVQEYNNNRLAESQNSLNYQQSLKSSNRRKSSQDIFFKSFASSKTTTTTTTTPRPTTPRPTTPRPTTPRPATSSTTTSAPLVFRSPIPTNEPISSPSPTPRRPSLETFESYEIESVAGLTPQNSFNRLANTGNGNNDSPKYYDDSYEIRDPEPSPSTTSTTTTTTLRPIFHNSYRSPLPISSTVNPPPQTYQQQASRFNEDFFKKIPSSTQKSVSKAAQFYVNSNTHYYSTPEVRQPTTNPFTKSTTEIPLSFKNNYASSTTRSIQQQSTEYTDNRYQDKNAAFEPLRKSYKSTSDETTTKRTFPPKTDRGLSNRGHSTFADTLYKSTTFKTPTDNTRDYFASQDKFSHEHSKKKQFSAQIPQLRPQEDDIIRPRSFSGTTNNANQVNRQSNRDSFGFSTIPPPTTAEPNTAHTTIRDVSNQGVSINNGVTIFQRLTTLKPEKFSIFFGKSTTYSNKDSESKFSTSEYYEPTSTFRSEVVNDADFGQRTERYSTQDAESFFASSTSYPITESTTYSTPTPTTTTTTPTTTVRQQQRRGQRRRVNRPRHQNPKTFDPEFKYSRRIEPLKVKNDVKNDEIFAAEESIFSGRPNSNIYQSEKSTKIPDEKIEKPTKAPGTPKLAENFGRRIRVNTRREQFLRSQQPQTEAPVAVSTDAPVSKTQPPRRLIKRLKVKTTSTTVAAHEETSTTPASTTVTFPTTTELSTPAPTDITKKESPSPAFSFKGSTLRPVTRISVKTKIGSKKLFEKDSEFRVPPSLLPSSSTSKSSFNALDKLKKIATTSTTTTPEPELVTASDAEIYRKKLKKLTTIFHGLDEVNFTTPTTYRPLSSDIRNSTSSVVIKVTNKSHKSTIPTPISFKEPILSKGKVDRKETKVEVKQSQSIHEESTRSPDYDYAYYNTDTDDDYADVAKKLVDHKNYGKKPGGKKGHLIGAA